MHLVQKSRQLVEVARIFEHILLRDTLRRGLNLVIMDFRHVSRQTGGRQKVSDVLHRRFAEKRRSCKDVVVFVVVAVQAPTNAWVIIFIRLIIMGGVGLLIDLVFSGSTVGDGGGLPSDACLADAGCSLLERLRRRASRIASASVISSNWSISSSSSSGMEISGISCGMSSAAIADVCWMFCRLLETSIRGYRQAGDSLSGRAMRMCTWYSE